MQKQTDRGLHNGIDVLKQWEGGADAGVGWTDVLSVGWVGGAMEHVPASRKGAVGRCWSNTSTSTQLKLEQLSQTRGGRRTCPTSLLLHHEAKAFCLPCLALPFACLPVLLKQLAVPACLL